MEEKKYTYKQFIADLWSYTRPYKGKFLLATVLRLASDLTNLYPALALSSLVLLVTKQQSADRDQQIIIILIAWIVLSIFRTITKQVSKIIGFNISEKAALDAKLKTLKHIFTLDYAWQEKESSGNKLKRMENGGRGIDLAIRVFFVNLIEGTINTFGIALVLFTEGSFLSISIGIFIIIYYVGALLLTKKASQQSYIVSKQEEKVEGLAFESLNNVRTIKSLNLSNRIDSKIIKLIDTLFDQIKRRIFLYQRRGLILGLLFHFYEIGMITFLVLSVLSGKFEVSVIVLFAAYLQKVDSSVWEMAEVTQDLSIAKVWVQRMQQIQMIEPSIKYSNIGKKYPENWKSIEFKNVSFSYGQGRDLYKLNFKAKRGEKIGIVGLSGAGKSTLFKLLLNLYQDYTGDIKIGGTALKKIRADEYIQHLSIVMQDTELFNTTLKENITIASKNARYRKKDLQDVLAIANLNKLIDKLPEGLKTIVGEKGVKLSGGEKQRVGIARALFRNPDLLLLDEATSHLDVQSEKEIQTSLDKVFKKVTAIVIAHRLSTIKKMDRIFVLKDGKIVEEGPFEFLVKNDKYFAKLWQKQKI